MGESALKSFSSQEKKKKIMGTTLISPGTRRTWPYGLKPAVKEMNLVL